MKRKLLTFMFVLAFSISTFAALGVSGVSAGPLLGTPGTTVNAPDAACDGAILAFVEVSGNTAAPANAGLTFDNGNC